MKENADPLEIPDPYLVTEVKGLRGNSRRAANPQQAPCTRYALLLSEDGRKRRMPITDVMELRETYEFHGDVYTVVSVFTQEDISP